MTKWAVLQTGLLGKNDLWKLKRLDVFVKKKIRVKGN